MKKRFLSILVTAAMLLSLLPVSVFAEGAAFVEITTGGVTTQYSDAVGFFTAFQTMEEGTVKLLSDFAVGAQYIPVGEGQKITLDFNGFKLTKNSSGEVIKNEGALFVKDTGTDGGIDAVSHCIRNYGTLTIDGGVYTTTQINASTAILNDNAILTVSDCTVKASFYALASTGGKVTVNGGTFISTSCSHEGSYAYAVSSQGGEFLMENGFVQGVQGGLSISNGTATINGGTFETVVCTNEADSCQNGGTAHYAIYVAGERGNATAEINGGTYTSVSKAAISVGNDNTGGDGGINADATVVIKGGEFNGGGDHALLTGPVTGTPRIEGGTFNSTKVSRQKETAVVLADYLPEGYAVSPSGDKFVVEKLGEENSVAKIGSKYYATLADAIAAAPTTEFSTKAAPTEATKITLLKDTNDGLDIGTSGEKLQNIEIDLNGHTLTLGPAVGSSGTETNGLRVLSYSKVKIENGTILSSDLPNDKNGYVRFMLVNYGTMVLDNVTVTPGKTVYGTVNNCGNLTLSGKTTIETASTGGTGYEFAVTNDVYWAHYSNFDASLNIADENVKVGVVQVERYENGRGGNQGKVVLNISAGAVEKIIEDGATSVDVVGNITGGYFNVDPSAYLAKGKAALSSDKADYIYMVGEKKAEVIHADPAVENPAASDTTKSDSEKQLAEDLGDAFDSGKGGQAPEVSTDVITAAANTKAQANNITTSTEITVSGEKKTVAEAVKALNGSSEVDVVIVVQPYLDIKIQDVTIKDSSGSETKTMTLDITPMVKTVATTKTVVDAPSTEIKADGDNPNAVPVKEEVLPITKPVDVTIPLPSGFVAKTGDTYPNIYVNHTKNSRTYTYTAVVKEERGHLLATFTNPHGFSTFTLTTTNDAVAEVDGVGYATFQDAVDAVANGGTINALKDIESTVSGNKTFTVEDNGHTVTLTAASGYNLSRTGGTYTVSSRPSGGGGGGGSSSTYAINVKTSSHGSVTASGKSASSGRTVTLTVKPDAGYVLDELTVTDSKGRDVKLAKKSGSSYTFEMPASTVTVEAAFKKGVSQRPVDACTDVAESAWYYEAVDSVLASGIMSGTSSTTFAPNATLTRAMVAQTLWAAQGKPVVNDALTYDDVAGGDWYAEAIRWAASEHIVSGYSAAKFGPNDPVTREQLMTILYAYAKNQGKGFSGNWMFQLGYADTAEISTWAYEAACWCTTNGVISGRTGNLLDPQGTATRAEAAQMLVNFMQVLDR